MLSIGGSSTDYLRIGGGYYYYLRQKNASLVEEDVSPDKPLEDDQMDANDLIKARAKMNAIDSEDDGDEIETHSNNNKSVKTHNDDKTSAFADSVNVT